jgi:heme/copper-type cytochrome/quinol oxidase subunit 2
MLAIKAQIYENAAIIIMVVMMMMMVMMISLVLPMERTRNTESTRVQQNKRLEHALLQLNA